MDHDRSAVTQAGRWVLIGIPLAFLGVFFLWPLVSIVATGLFRDGSLDVGAFRDFLGLGKLFGTLTHDAFQILLVLLKFPFDAFLLFRSLFDLGDHGVDAFLHLPDFVARRDRCNSGAEISLFHPLRAIQKDLNSTRQPKEKHAGDDQV